MQCLADLSICLLCLPLRQSRGLLVVDLKIFVNDCGFSGEECMVFGDHFFLQFIAICLVVILWASILVFFSNDCCCFYPVRGSCEVNGGRWDG